MMAMTGGHNREGASRTYDNNKLTSQFCTAASGKANVSDEPCS